MTAKPKTRKAPGIALASATDPIFAAIAAVKEQNRRLMRIEGTGEGFHDAWSDWHEAVMRLARTKPASFAGTVAFVGYIARDVAYGHDDWHAPALKTCAAALKKMVAS